MARLIGISPVLLIADVDRSVAYYEQRLGFTCTRYGQPPDFVVAVRDEATLLLALCTDTERIVPNWRIVDMTWNAFDGYDVAFGQRLDG